jgi:hypothetical protein
MLSISSFNTNAMSWINGFKGFPRHPAVLGHVGPVVGLALNSKAIGYCSKIGQDLETFKVNLSITAPHTLVRILATYTYMPVSARGHKVPASESAATRCTWINTGLPGADMLSVSYSNKVRMIHIHTYMRT